jgi:very-short-patch-repair endonuclease
VAEEADGRAHTPFESVLRAISLDVPGLRLEPQQLIVEPGVRFRPDLVDRRRRIVVEADSFGFHSDRLALQRDCERYNELGRRGWLVLRFTWEHAMFAPSYLVAVLTDAAALPLRPVA